MRSSTAVLAAAVAVSLWVADGLPHAQTTRQSAGAAPKLVVFIVADQFRADYVTSFGDAWTGGLKTILEQGASFTEAAYPYYVTKTCAGHATIGTGLLPGTHGLIDNQWYDRTTHQFVSCTEDAQAHALPFAGAKSEEHHSAKWLAVPNFADELRRQVSGGPKVVTLSLKARSAIGLGGHGGPGTTIVWKDEEEATFATSTAFARRAPPLVDAYIRAHAITAEQFDNWTRVRPAADYKFADQAPGEPAARQVFPHLFEEPVRLSDATPDVFDSWDNTPAADDFLAGLAEHLIDRERLGQRQTTDVLGVSFSVLDLVGHDYGPRSHEVQDVLFRLDAALGRLLATLDRKVGREQYVLVFTSDHGVAALPEQSFPAPTGGRAGGAGAAGAVTGRLTNASIGNAVEAALDKVFGRGTYVEAISVPYIYFRPGILDRIRGDAKAAAAVEAAAKGVRGVNTVYWSTDLASTSPTTDAALTALRLGYFPGRSGDFAYTFDRDWVSSAGTNHGTHYDYDQRVPLAFYGAGIARGRHATKATPADIVPTLSALTGVRMAKVDGRVLGEALTNPGTR